ncbi:general secretion pathway protein GspK [Ottowia testudinis]|uniref:general secretion pathway protein GspK n=1 Tax=Ottowia testudinis TaxID=2816950 RepID=UPI001FB19493|nr:type II secretion system protein GspK [Ottowia testudinis]
MALELDRMRAQVVLDGALQLVAGKMITDKSLSSSYRRLHMRLGDADAWVEIVPSSGLIDINVARPELLQALFQRVGGVPAGEATALGARIRDFIDPDDVPSPLGGAELAQYRAAGSPVVPRNTGIDDMSELKLVLGMTPELYEIIAPFLGVNGQQRIALYSAPPALIDALSGQPGLGARIQASPPEMRGAMLEPGITTEFFSIVPAGGADQTIRLRAYVQTRDQRWWQRQMWLDLQARPGSTMPWTTRAVEPTRRVNRPDQEFNP